MLQLKEIEKKKMTHILDAKNSLSKITLFLSIWKFGVLLFKSNWAFFTCDSTVSLFFSFLDMIVQLFFHRGELCCLWILSASQHSIFKIQSWQRFNFLLKIFGSGMGETGVCQSFHHVFSKGSSLFSIKNFAFWIKCSETFFSENLILISLGSYT